MIYIIYGTTILITIILYFLVENKKSFLNKIGIATILAAVSVLIIGLMSNMLLNNNLNNFNITKITSIIFRKFIYNSILLLVVGIIEIFISKLMKKTSKNIKN